MCKIETEPDMLIFFNQLSENRAPIYFSFFARDMGKQEVLFKDRSPGEALALGAVSILGA